MADLKRDSVKYIRDLAKSAYKKDTKCYICGSTENLQFHHFYSLAQLWNNWIRKNKIIINTVDDIIVERENFKGIFFKEIYSDTVTLCKTCHADKLHKIYGKSPTLATAEKQKRWCDKMKLKYIDTHTRIKNNVTDGIGENN